MSEPVRCPFCESADVEDVSLWGGQIITRQCRCRACNTYFEVIRDDYGDALDQSVPSGSGSKR